MTEPTAMPAAPRYPCLDGVLRPFESASGVVADLDLLVWGVVDQGHGHASGRNPRSPYPGGTLQRQYPLFKDRGLDLGRCFPGTLNVSIAPLIYKVERPAYRFVDVRWFPERKPEDFSFCRCRVVAGGRELDGYVYYPDPATKTRHPDNPSHLQVIAPFFPGLRSGDRVGLRLRSVEIVIVQGGEL